MKIHNIGMSNIKRSKLMCLILTTLKCVILRSIIKHNIGVTPNIIVLTIWLSPKFLKCIEALSSSLVLNKLYTEHRKL